MIFWKNESKKKCFWDYLNLTCFGFSFILRSTDYGHPMKPFSIEIHNFWAWADKLGHLGYFRPIYKLPTPILVQFPCFPLFNHYFNKKKLSYGLLMSDDIKTGRSMGSDYWAALGWEKIKTNSHRRQTQTDVITH